MTATTTTSGADGYPMIWWIRRRHTTGLLPSVVEKQQHLARVINCWFTPVGTFGDWARTARGEGIETRPGNLSRPRVRKIKKKNSNTIYYRIQTYTIIKYTWLKIGDSKKLGKNYFIIPRLYLRSSIYGNTSSEMFYKKGWFVKSSYVLRQLVILLHYINDIVMLWMTPPLSPLIKYWRWKFRSSLEFGPILTGYYYRVIYLNRSDI